MDSYRICGLTLQSNIPIPELAPGDGGPAEFTVQPGAGDWDFSDSNAWLNHWNAADGSVWLVFARLEAGYLLRFPEFVDFVVSPDARTIHCHPRAGCPPETMRHLLLNQVMPVVLSHAGRLVLHAAACATPLGVMAFMGTTGMGKSTLAASFALQGFSVLTDDCLLVEQQGEGMMTFPSYPGLRLWPESVGALFGNQPALQPLAHYTDKKRIPFEQDRSNGSLYLRAIYVLTDPEEAPDTSAVSLTPLAPAEAILETVRHTFVLDITDRDRLAGAFRQYEWLARSVPFFRLAYPRDHALLPEVNRALLDHMDLLPDRQPVGS